MILTMVCQVTMSINREWSLTDKTKYMTCALSRLAMDHSLLVSWVVSLSHVATKLIKANAGVSASFTGYELKTFGEAVGSKLLTLMRKPRNVEEIRVGLRVIHMGMRNVVQLAQMQSVPIFNEYMDALADTQWKELAA